MGQMSDPMFSAATFLTPSALGVLRRNSGNTGYEVAVPLWLDEAQTLTGQKTFETGATGTAPVVFRQTGGVAGTDQGQIGHSGSVFTIENKDGTFRFINANNGGFHFRTQNSGDVFKITNGNDAVNFFKFNDGAGGIVTLPVLTIVGDGRVRVDSTANFGWCTGLASATELDAGFARAAAAVVKVTNGSAGGGQLEFPQVADVGTPSTNSARIGAEDVAGTAELIVADEAGTETQISPHAADAPAFFYDGDGTNKIMDTVLRSLNPAVGRVEFINLTRVARAVEAIAAGNLAAIQALPANRRQCYHVETLAAYNARTGRNKVARTWAQIQDAHQARYDAARAAEQVALAEWTAARDAELAERAAWLALPDEDRDETPQPPVRAADSAPAVRPAANIRKVKPPWLAQRGA